MGALGRHLLLELKNCNHEVLNDVDFVRRCLRETAEQIGATVVNECCHQFSPHGVSGVVVIAESHLCIHTWPEHNYAAMDLFTCGEVIDPEQAVKPLVKKFGAKDFSYIELKRGVLENAVAGCASK